MKNDWRNLSIEVDVVVLFKRNVAVQLAFIFFFHSFFIVSSIVYLSIYPFFYLFYKPDYKSGYISLILITENKRGRGLNGEGACLIGVRLCPKRGMSENEAESEKLIVSKRVVSEMGAARKRGVSEESMKGWRGEWQRNAG